jgi:excisionase family DNA binding protein
MNPDTLLTVHQVADRLHVPDETVRRWLREGELEGVKGKRARWRVCETSLERFLVHEQERSFRRRRRLTMRTIWQGLSHP